jgi:hypothetical protein
MTNTNTAPATGGAKFTLEAEVDHAAASAPPDITAPPPAPAIAHQVIDDEPWRREWLLYTKMASNLLAGLLLPQWQITAEERVELSESLAMILYCHFPDGVNGKYAGYFRLLACSSLIVATRISANNGKLPPLGPPRAPEPEQGREAAQARSSTPDPHTPVVN